MNKIIRVNRSPNLRSITISLPNWKYELVKVRTPSEPVFGLTSKTSDNKHIICLDYDLIDKNAVMGDILMLKSILKPSLLYLFTTYEEKDELGIVGNYHVLILDKFSFRDAEQIMSITHSDDIHRKLANKSRYRAWVIRISDKGNRSPPKLIKSWNFNGRGETSLAHYLLIKKLYPHKINVKNIKFDKFTTTTLTHYNSASKLDINKIK